VIGYIIATDDLDYCYIIPLDDAFRDIQEKLGATRVSLPTVQDIENARQNNWNMAGVSSYSMAKNRITETPR
jgi:hypothetical protein